MSTSGDSRNGSPVAITGWGMASPLGVGAQQTWRGLLAERFITDHAGVPLARTVEIERVTQLGMQAAREAIEMARWGGEVLDEEGTALIVATSKGPIESWIAGAAALSGEFGVWQTAADLARRLEIGGARLTVSAACASSLLAIGRAQLMLMSGEAKRVLVVGAESSLHPLFIGSFQRLGVLPRKGVGCRPFDHQREGFLMSEAAAAVCLERIDPSRPGIYLERCCGAGDATHLTGHDPHGASIRHCLQHVVGNDRVDLVHAHGTGTIANDPVELAVIESVVGSAGGLSPAVYSHKGALGHSLGASGLVAVVINCMAHGHGVVPPNVKTESPLATTGVMIKREALTRPVRRSLAMAAGFGGAVAAVSLRSRPDAA